MLDIQSWKGKWSGKKGERRTWEVERLEIDDWFAWQGYHQEIKRYDLCVTILTDSFLFFSHLLHSDSYLPHFWLIILMLTPP